MPYSTTLAKLAATDRRFDAYEFYGEEDGHWLYTACGWINSESGTHVIHEDTVRAVLAQVPSITPCDDDCCVTPAKEST